MKKFISGVVTGVILASTIAFAASYVAEQANFKILVNGEEFNCDPPAVAIDGRAYLPLRAMGDVLGVPVNWNEELFQAEVGSIPVETINKAIQIDGNVSVDGFSFSQLSVEKQEYTESYYCRVEVENNTGEDVESMLFSISFFDADGKRVGVASLGIVSNGLKNGETKTATLYSSDNLSEAKTARYEISMSH